ncbi:AI-2E family transporter [Planosporangium thailandense]|uniref:AI-2E family transporter n=1 Tax=Planosporangium thailandense TaxID=765197 RepID=A0ABX0XYC5_9ACTN|nr:AI-2E family transporter [Planosporangium thailandense]NJC71055.1 AI-2E family transporter [Planosporangium thailandense]
MTALEAKTPAGDGEPVGAAGVDETAAPDPSPRRVSPGLVFRWAVAATLGVGVVLLGGYALYAVRSLLVLVTISLFIAVSLDPAVRWLVRKGLGRPAAVTLVTVFVLALFGVFIWSIVPPLVEQGGKLFSNLPGYLRDLPAESRTFRELSDRYHITDRLSALAADLPTRIAGSAVSFVQQFLGALLSTVTVLVLTIYFMVDMPRMRRGLVRLFPHRRRPQVADIINVVVDKVGAYMIGNLIISLFAGVSTFMCLSLMRVPFALPLAVTVAITDLIPLVGATLGAAIGVLVTIITVDVWPAGVVVLVFFVVYQQVENYLIAPRVLRNTVDMPSVAVLLVALLGGSVLGVVGALMSIPIAAAVKVVITPTIATMHQPPPPAEAVPEREASPDGETAPGVAPRR